ncbi:uncharacterized protein BDR25DRAFT_352365 [Lindgomyces ingoldianus]|uniref:Uncharacterized protein n=1 Tax=Lindgomyces ingoldianus TaxID=673940 RepID=A0ACB6R3R2_9PLEO|nr:uncharacterized protein BDR25DRAFT_352365 [Lindgomyces ingoldianus]KAF2473904.1 hypothetical protein BDR25DRAFT_352365 [Lindgomyces ingoldianus]
MYELAYRLQFHISTRGGVSKEGGSSRNLNSAVSYSKSRGALCSPSNGGSTTDPPTCAPKHFHLNLGRASSLKKSYQRLINL